MIKIRNNCLKNAQSIEQFEITNLKNKMSDIKFVSHNDYN